MAAPVFAQNVPTYATYTPYLTAEEYLAEPTGVDVSQLVPGRRGGVNAATLTRIISRASSWADQICQQVLAATLDIQSGAYRIQSDRTLRIPVDFTPLIAVTDCAVGPDPTSLTPLADLSGLWLDKKVVRVPVGGMQSGGFAGRAAPAGPGRLYARLGYVNGFAHSPTTAVVLSGALQVMVKNPLGLFPGLPLTLYDSQNTEQVVVGSWYEPGSTVVPLATPLGYSHAAGLTLSALPGFARQAVISLTSALIKTRGSEAVSMPMMGGAFNKVQLLAPGMSEDVDMAMELLDPLRRVR